MSYIGWRNASGFYVSRDAEYSIDALVVSSELTAVTASSYAEEGVYYAYVEFVSLYNQLMASDTWCSTDSAVEKPMPGGPSRGVGYSFEGWSVNGTDVITPAELIASIDVSTTSIRLTPVYSVLDKPVTVRFYRDGVLISEEAVNAGTVRYFSADQLEGRYFSCWSVGAPAETAGIASTRGSYRVLVNHDMSVYANYVDDPANAAVDGPYAVVSAAYTHINENGVKYLYYDLTRDIPDGFEVIEQGALRGTSASVFGSGQADANLRLNESDGSPLTSNVTKVTTASKTNRGTNQYYFSVKETSVDLVIYVRSFAVISDGSHVYYVYSPVKEGSYNAINAENQTGVTGQ